VKFEQLED